MDVRRLRLFDAGGDALQGLIHSQESKKSKTRRAEFVTRVGTRMFYRVGERWIDADYDKKVEARKVELYSDEYFKLVRKHPELARCFAIGERVIVVLEGTAYETVPPPSD